MLAALLPAAVLGAASCPSDAPGLLPFTPQPGAEAVVLTGTRRLWQGGGGLFTRLLVEAGAELVFREGAAENVSVAAQVIEVRGKLTAGTPDCPLLGHLSFTLTDGPEQTDVPFFNGSSPGPSTKILIVRPGGELSLHGRPKTSWTRLTRSSEAGSTELFVDPLAASSWLPGDRLVVTSSGFRAGDAEDLYVQSVDGGRVTVSAPLRHRKYADAGTPELSTEVGVLTRNVVVEGSLPADAPPCPSVGPDDPVPPPDAWKAGCFGGHTVFLWNATVRMDGVELRRMGQANLVGRYPVHWHVAGPSWGSYVRNSSVHDSFQRCVTLHGTFGVDVAGVVCARTMGHGFYLEDAIEYGNTIRGNLAVSIRAGPLLCSDNSHRLERGVAVPPSVQVTGPFGPSGFWITNPNNTVEGNVAAGVGGRQHGFGFWIALPDAPFDPSQSALKAAAAELGISDWVFNQRPRLSPISSFRGNVAHSNYVGFEFDGLPTGSEPKGYGSTCSIEGYARYQGLATLERPIAWKNYRGIWLNALRANVSDALMADNGAGINMDGQTAPQGDAPGHRLVVNATLVGETANQYAVRENPACLHLDVNATNKTACNTYARRGWEVMSGAACLVSPRYENFTAGGGALVSHWDPTQDYPPVPFPYQPSPGAVVGAAGAQESFLRFRNSTVVNTGRLLDLTLAEAVRNMVVYSRDSGSPKVTALVPISGHLIDPSACVEAGGGAWACDGARFGTVSLHMSKGVIALGESVDWEWRRTANPHWPSRWRRLIGSVDTRMSAPFSDCMFGSAAGLREALRNADANKSTLSLRAWNGMPGDSARGALWLGKDASLASCGGCGAPPSGPVWNVSAGPQPVAVIRGGWLLWALPLPAVPGAVAAADIGLVFGDAEPGPAPTEAPEVCGRPPTWDAATLQWAEQLCSAEPAPAPTPRPGPSPPSCGGWKPCGGSPGEVCCDPVVSPPQRCPSGNVCCDCRAAACACQ
eukprot:TRINITY_DN39209_c0_g1_i1.p1 TRINITY_DN39209_c0_g1~~TRINITY_DN39209_c0_g1_i1.p1  ORF type:complete len:997 (+),score=230.82 TRINITY_DN39209_c0_g1_i1:54-2993(+)